MASSASQVRQVSLADLDRQHYAFDGSVLQGALCLGDCDGDREHELVVGTTDGALLVFKGLESEAVAARQGLGTLVWVAVEDALGGGPTVLALSAEGQLHMLELRRTEDAPSASAHAAALAAPSWSAQATGEDESHAPGSSAELAGAQSAALAMELRPLASFKVPWNVTCAMTLDVTGDGTRSLVVAAHDGGAMSETKLSVLALPRRPPAAGAGDAGGAGALETIAEWCLAGAAVSLSHTKTLSNSHTLLLVGLQFGGFCSVSLDGTVAHHRLCDSSNQLISTQTDKYSLAPRPELLRAFDSGGTLLVDRPTYVLGLAGGADEDEHERGVEREDYEGDTGAGAEADDEAGSADVLRGLAGDGSSSTSRGSSGGFRSNPGEPASEAMLAAVSFGGQLRIERIFYQREALFNELAWQEQQPRQLFAVQAADVDGDGTDEVVVCAWDGLTTVYDLAGNPVRFQFDGRVQGFLAGSFSPAQGKPACLCMVYVTLGEGIYVYTNVRERLRSIPEHNLVDVLRDQGRLEYALELLEHACAPDKKKRLLASLQHLKDGALEMAYYAALLREALYGAERASGAAGQAAQRIANNSVLVPPIRPSECVATQHLRKS
jgi:hypothetical protein